MKNPTDCIESNALLLLIAELPNEARAYLKKLTPPALRSLQKVADELSDLCEDVILEKEQRCE